MHNPKIWINEGESIPAVVKYLDRIDGKNLNIKNEICQVSVFLSLKKLENNFKNYMKSSKKFPALKHNDINIQDVAILFIKTF